MFGFGKHRKPKIAAYDKTGKIPVICASICTGEQVAGFKDTTSGKFEELMLIRSSADLQEFLYQYQVEETAVKKEW
ncbi:MAG: aspartate dehydrogenase [Oscillibacter sp.]|nr:aspartate dehydrogenase [Oscillibacter sp.]